MEGSNYKTENNNKIRTMASKISKIGRCNLKHTEKIIPKTCHCKLCGIKLTNYNYQNHFRNKHSITKEEYFSNNQDQLIYKTKNYVYVNKTIVPKGALKKKEYKNLSLTQAKLLMLVKSLSLQPKLPILEDLMFKRAHTDISSAYILFRKYKEILEYTKLSGKKVGENEEYLTIRYGKKLAKEMLKKKSNRVKGKNNPGYQHNGKFSPFSDKFKGYTNQTVSYTKEDIICKRKNTINNNPASKNTNVEFYLAKGMNLEDAKYTLSKRQIGNGLKWYESKYGKDEGLIRYNDRMKKWMTSFKKCNFSKISQELFDAISKEYDTTNVYYATLEREDMKEYENKEFILKLSKSYCRPDFVDVFKRKIIEFDGEYWHHGPQVNKSRDLKRDNAIMEQNYTIFHVREKNYRNNKSKVIQECLKFLNK